MKKMCLESYAMAATCLALAGVNSVLAADRHVPGDYATIQAAVDAAASGDTVHVAPGVYVEQVVIQGKNLTLVGQPGTILRAFPGMEAPPPPATWRSMVFVGGGSDATLRDLAFEGEQVADQNEPGLAGVYFLDAGGGVENCRFTGIRERTPGSHPGVAILVLNDFSESPLRQMRVVGNTIVDSYAGLWLQGTPDRLSLNFTAADNTIIGLGPIGAQDGSAGIHITDGVTGNVTGNTISAFSYIGDGAAAPLMFGILALGGYFPDNLAPLEPLVFEGNVLRDNQVHLALVLGNDSVIRNNTFVGTAPGVRPAGLFLSGENVQVSGNAFRDMPEGIRIGGMDPDFGDVLGLAVNAQLTDNRFCGVETPVNLQPLATATEEGTLTCPFPEPELNIERAVRLSWSELGEGHLVEAAPTPEGPWMEVAGTASHRVVVEGQQQVWVLAGEAARFFRLRQAETP